MTCAIVSIGGEPMPARRLTSEAASRLSKLGARKGGRARANVLTAAARSAIARRAVQARWAKARAATGAKIDVWGVLGTDKVTLIESKFQAPIALFSGELQIGAKSLACHVL